MEFQISLLHSQLLRDALSELSFILLYAMSVFHRGVYWELNELQFGLAVEVFEVRACIECTNQCLGGFLCYHGEVVLSKKAIVGFMKVGQLICPDKLDASYTRGLHCPLWKRPLLNCVRLL